MVYCAYVREPLPKTPMNKVVKTIHSLLTCRILTRNDQLKYPSCAKVPVSHAKHSLVPGLVRNLLELGMGLALVNIS